MNLNIVSKGLLVMSILSGLYILIALLAPISMKYGYSDVGNKIYEVYEKFCHQRVERSLFLFGRNSFHSVATLKEESFLPEKSQSESYPEYFGHGYVGNEDIGYKVAVCIRDIALYLSFALAGLVLSFKKKVKVGWLLITLLVLPIFIDVGIQMVLESIKTDQMGLVYINDINKRIVTGTLAGIGIALFLRKIFESSLTNKEETGNI